MKFKLLTEALHRLLNGDAFITDSEYQVKDLLLNKPKAYRILYDWNIDSYMICDANEHIHFDLLKDAFKQGYYIKAEQDESLDELVREYIADGNRYNTVDGYKDLGVDGEYENGIEPFLLYMIYIPKGIEEKEVNNSPSSDGYDAKKEYSFGTLWFRNADDFSDKCGLLKILYKINVEN